MKLKGINPLEQHVEKIVLVVVALFALAVFVFQFDVFGDPNAIDIKGQTVSPERAPDVVSDMARATEGQLNQERVPDLPPPVSLIDVFEDRLADAGHAGGVRIVLGVDGPDIPTGPETPREPITGETFAAVTPPAPRNVVAAVHGGTIDPFEPIYHPELADHLPPEQPLDKRSVTVQATFDAAALRDLLRNPSGGAAMPTSWWENEIEILDVEIVRSTLGDDGTWSAGEVVATLPGRFSLRERLADPGVLPRDLPSILDAEQRNREELRRPAYYAEIAGPGWVWPALADELRGGDANREAIDALLAEKRRNDSEIERIDRRLDDRKDRPGDPDPGDRSDAGGWPHLPDRWVAQFGSPDAPKPEEREDREDRGRSRLEAQRAELLERNRQIIEELRALGVDADGRPLDDQRLQSFDEPVASLSDPATEGVTVWSHDLSADPGTSYRYKVRVWVTNPFFAHVNALGEEQRPLAEGVAISSEDSAWSDPVRVEHDTVFFVTGTTEQGSLGRERSVLEVSSEAEIYRFFYGYWRKAEVKLRPGDLVHGAIDLTDFPELPVFTVVTAPGSHGGDPRPAVEESTAYEPSSVTVAVEDTVMLDVAPVPGDPGDREVALRDRDGRITLRHPSRETEDAIRAWMGDSHTLALTAEVRQPGGGADPRRPAAPASGPRDDRDAPGGPSDDPFKKPSGPPI